MECNIRIAYKYWMNFANLPTALLRFLRGRLCVITVHACWLALSTKSFSIDPHSTLWIVAIVASLMQVQVHLGYPS